MEYCEYDLFAIVMWSVSKAEIYCDFSSSISGVKYMLDSGLAHKTFEAFDNCVINSQGIVKMIDFGSAVVYRYPRD